MQKLWELLESPATDVKGLKRRTDLLVTFHIVLSAAALLVLGLVVWRIQHLVTLTQRSNVETLVLAFIVVFLGYVLLTTYSATWGALRIVALRLFGGRDRGQRWIQRRANAQQKETKRSYLDVLVRGPLGDPIEIPLKDGVGPLGLVRIQRAEIACVQVPKDLPLTTFQLIAKTLEQVGEPKDAQEERHVVFWDAIDKESSAVYAAQTTAFDRLAKLNGEERIWPELHVDDKGVARLGAVLEEALPLLRESLLMPDIEYSAEFSIPVIPEPFAFVQLRRSTQHADPVASLGCMTAVALVMFALIALVIVLPPWVPGI